jgi:hypothetical protein
MPLCPQITITPITVTTTGITTTSVIAANAPVTTEQANELQTEIDSIEAAVNGKNHIYRQTTAPDGSVYALVEGDVWFDTDDGNKQYYWTGSAWVSVQDTSIAAATAAATAATNAANAATAAAAAAQTTADGKNRIYRQTTQPTGGTYVEGDLWFDIDDDNKFYRFTSGAWSSFTLGDGALASLSATKLTAGTIDASVITVSNINAGNISTGTLAADRISANSITGGKLAVETIEAVSIAALTITGAKIAAETITAGKIATATITATQIAGGTITADEIAANTITALEIEAGSITVDRLTAGTLTAFTLRTSSGARRVTVSASTNSISFTESSTTVGHIGPASIDGIVMHYGSTFNPNVTTYPNAYVSSADARIAYSSANYVQASSTGVVISGNLYSLTNFFNQDTTTTTNTANTWMSATNGLTRRSTASSQRYKENIVDIRTVPALDPNKLLSLPVRAFTYKADYLDSADNRAGSALPGFIAEEVAQAYEIAADKNDGVIESWNDRFVVPGILALVQDLHARVETLEAGTQ